MMLASLTYPKTYRSLLAHDVWQEALAWLKASTDMGVGEYEIRQQDIFAYIQDTPTQPREQGLFEAHQVYIDLHYCRGGGEIIEWAPAATLQLHTAYDTVKDAALFNTPLHATRCYMAPGAFAIFLPADAHMPKIADGVHPTVQKVVLKIRYSLLS